MRISFPPCSHDESNVEVFFTACGRPTGRQRGLGGDKAPCWLPSTQARALHTIKHAASRCSLIWRAHVRGFHQSRSAFHPSIRPALRINAPQLNSAFGSRVPRFIFFKAALEVAYKMKEKSLNCNSGGVSEPPCWCRLEKI